MRNASMSMQRASSLARRGAIARAGRPSSAVAIQAQVDITFKVPYKTQMGEHLGLSGNVDHLGTWQLERKINLEWTEGDIWVGRVSVPAGTKLEYKYVVVRTDGMVEWSPGLNYKLDVNYNAGANLVVAETWGNVAERELDIDEDGEGSYEYNGAEPAVPPGNDIGEKLSRLNSATERLKQVAYTNGSVADSLVLQMLENYSSVTLDKLHNMLKAAKKGFDMSQEQLKGQLDKLVAAKKVVQQGGLYMSAKGAPAPQSNASRNGAAPPAQQQQQPQQQQQQQQPVRSAPPSSQANRAAPAPAAAAPVALPQGMAQFEPAVMSLLGNYSGLALDRMHRMLQSDPRARFGRSQADLAALVESLVARNLVTNDNGVYRKGAAPARAATPTAARPATPTPAPAPAKPAPAPAPAPAPQTQQQQRPSTPSASRASSPQPSHEAPVPANMAQHEPAVLKLLSDYSGLALDRMHRMLQNDPRSRFAASQSDLQGLLASMVSKGTVEFTGGVYRKGTAKPSVAAPAQAARVATPSPARPATPAAAPAPVKPPVPAPAPQRAPSPAPARASAPAPAPAPAKPAAPAPAPQRAPSPVPARSAAPSASTSSASALAVYEPAILKLLSIYSGLPSDRMHRMMMMDARLSPRFTSTQQELEGLLSSMVQKGSILEEKGVFKKGAPGVAAPVASPAPARATSPVPAPAPRSSTPQPLRSAPPSSSSASSNGAVSNGAAAAPAAPSVPANMAQHEPAVLKLLSDYSGLALDRMHRMLQNDPRSRFAASQSDLQALLSALVARGAVEFVGGVYKKGAARAVTPTASYSNTAHPRPRTPQPVADGPSESRLRSPSPRRSMDSSSDGEDAAPKARATSPRKKKDPSAPKKNLSAYQIFCTDNREAMKQRFPGVAFSEITRMLAEAWRGAPEHIRAKYENLAAQDKQRYERELQQARAVQPSNTFQW